MANTDRPFGLRFIETINGEPPANVPLIRCRLPVGETDATFAGDPVIRLTSNSGLATPNLNQVDGLMYVQRATGADNEVVFGVIVSFAYDPTNLGSNYCAGTVERDCFVIADPNALFEVQSDVTGIAYTDVGKNCLLTMTAGSTVTGLSKAVATGASANASYPYLIVGISRDPKNDITSAPYSKVIVKINNSAFANAALGV